MHEDGKRYQRFADVPGVGYEGDLQRRSRLQAREIVPTIEEYDFHGKTTISLSLRPSEGTLSALAAHGLALGPWSEQNGDELSLQASEGSSSASPAHGLAFGSWSEQNGDEIRERVLNALELPGQLSDYHFVLQGAADALWKRRREEPWQIAFIEWLYWLDVLLVESHPHVIEIEPGKGEYVHVLAFDWIVRLYEREGFLHEALAAAERFARFFPGTDTVSDLRARVAQLREEHE